MFCPMINGECRGPDCVRWMAAKQTCYDRLLAGQTLAFQDEMAPLTSFLNLWWKLETKRLLEDPALPDEVKEELRNAEDAQTLERILRDTGLI